MESLRVDELQRFVGGPQAVCLLDVREGWEVQTARIELPGTRSLHIPMQTVPARLHEIPRAQPVVCICHHGARSAQVVAYLMRQGYERVYNLAGGVDAWSLQVDPAVPRY
ncbi:MAG: sulfurtransferase [Burkholderiales bacterium]|nr:sulfurtransferase [Burkholderiales bacterium]MDE1925950.1 sulfurtransferase [Burkholderiales bacterium]MDE2505224.1 sulfurtransferase [Burkholderiales bacterium]